MPVLVHNKCGPSSNIGDYNKYPNDIIEQKYGMKSGQYHGQVKPDVISKAKQTSPELKQYLSKVNNPDILLDKKGYMAFQNPKSKSPKSGIVLGKEMGTIGDYIKNNWSGK